MLRERLLSVGEWIVGWNVFKRLDQLHEMERWDSGRIEQFKLDNLKLLANSAYAHVPLYRQLWKSAGIHPEDIKSLGDLSLFPIVTKQMLREAGDRALDRRYPKRKYRKVQTTGSSGKPLTIYKNKEHQGWFVAGIFIGWNWAGWEIGDPIMRMFISQKRSLAMRIEICALNYEHTYFEKFDEASYRRYIQKAISSQPTIIRATPFALYSIARYLVAENIYDLRPKAVCSTGSILYSSYRETIEKVFGCRVYDSYGAAEMIIAHQCEEGSYHILPSGIVEADTERQESGDSGPQRLLLTSLTNYAMPLIRYDIADMGTMGKSTCSCGRTWEHLDTICGRDTDVIVTPDGSQLFWAHLNDLFKGMEGVDMFQAVQEELSRISMRLVTNRDYRRDICEPMITDYLSKHGGPGLDIEITYVDSIPVPPSGKYRYIISRVTAPPR